jgi:SAM-dependent methyltransferase
VSMTKNERLLRRSRQLPSRVALRMLPLHALGELQSELRLTWLRLSRPRMDPRFKSSRNLLVNIGCGSGGMDGWVNIDCFPAPCVTCVRDCRTTLPLSDGSASGIFTEHFLEHLDYYEEAPRFLTECRRVLQPGGTLRVLVPDGEKYLLAYGAGDLGAMERFSPLVGLDPESDIAPFSLERSVLPFRTKMEVINFHFRQSGQHRFSYDFETLSGLLADCGFDSITRSGFGDSRHPDLAIDSEQRAPESLVVEASSPEYRP